jgi:hypothetical protein
MQTIIQVNPSQKRSQVFETRLWLVGKGSPAAISLRTQGSVLFLLNSDYSRDTTSFETR